MSVRLAAAALAGALLIAPAARADDLVAEPDSYRIENYRAPVPTTLNGARVLSTQETEAMWRAKSAAFIDVLPRAPKPKNLPAGTVWRVQPRLDIPGSIWLPDTGYGALAPPTEAYLKRGLAQASGGDFGSLLVFYCLEDCWMSWNAARRALTYGYRNVAWYPDGTDGWARANLPLQQTQPEPRPEE
ncbi:PQQ-dependent catabolism-associated CXXCW motif protein [Bradyrhizobium oligotrophicum]|uniref:PQQ-dependent catabolism-associated CXXCW motif protein n=1 Tax=Bradyrhizobium oligotrophicum TaxID=44255 RepID=UPI003EBDFBCD